MAGLLEGFIAGAAGFGAKQLERSLLADMQEERDARLAEIAKEQARYQSELAEGREQRAEERKRAPYKEAAKRAKGLIEGATTYEEDSGTAIAREPDDKAKARLKAQAYEEAGLPEAASTLRSEALTGEKIELEREHGRRREAQDERQHGERMKVLERQLVLAEKQLAKTADPNIQIKQNKDGKYIRVNISTGKTLGYIEGVDGTPLEGPKDVGDAAKLLVNAKTRILHDESAQLAKLRADPVADKSEIARITANVQRLEGEIEALLSDKAGTPREQPRQQYPNGTELMGRDGQLYVVVNGRPRLKKEMEDDMKKELARNAARNKAAETPRASLIDDRQP